MVGFTRLGRVEQFFRDLDARGTYFGSGTPEDQFLAGSPKGLRYRERIPSDLPDLLPPSVAAKRSPS